MREIPEDTRTEADAVGQIARDATKLEFRVGAFAFVSDGDEINVPVKLDDDGSPRVFTEAMEAAQKIRPPRASNFIAGDVASLVAWVARYRTERTMVYVDSTRVVAIVDDMPADSAAGAHRRHRATLPLTRHPRLQAWLAVAGKALAVDAFADFVEANLDDFVDASIANMVRNLEIADATTWKRTVDERGRLRLVSESAQGGTPIPRAFTTMLPVWAFDLAPIPVDWRLALTVAKGAASFTIAARDLDAVIAARVVELASALRDALPGTVILAGQP